MIKIQHIFLTFICIFFLINTSPYASAYVLYTVEDSLPTEFHANPDSLNRISNKPSESVLLLMQEMLDITNPIMLDIDLDNFENVEYLLEEMNESNTSFNNIIKNLNIDESDIRLFNDLNQENLASLNHLFENVTMFANLSEQESKYIEENNISMIFHIAQKSEIIVNNIKDNFDEFYLRQDAMIGSSAQFNLNGTKYVKSVEIFEHIVEEITLIQEARIDYIEKIKQNDDEFEILDLDLFNDDLDLNDTLQDELIYEMGVPFALVPPPFTPIVASILFFISVVIYYFKNKTRLGVDIILPEELKLNEPAVEIISNLKKSEYQPSINNKIKVNFSPHNEIKTNYHKLVGQNNFKKASNILYMHIKESFVSTRIQKPYNYAALTPREFAALFKKLMDVLNKSKIDEFIYAYEMVYYGGAIIDISDKDVLFNCWASVMKDIDIFNSADVDILGDDID